ncbi:MarR family winged helix-turn-helix transcriptional regulator [Microbacterium sulfonylureivorans]|uniref:MarR family winged helix-turn-helix transcriptional regulator n=1 Tax=Microbacterium sulfonylureivorans TaxID=2486854 RepID=UPI000FD8E6EE|nr:hypothetical protein [Microbacterium sulfonylureivorans]
MNTDDHDIDDHNTDGETAATPTDRRPLGYWLRAVDSLLTGEFAAAFEKEGVTRRDWMLLNLLSGDSETPGFADRLAHKGKRLRRLEDLGWAEEQGDGTWTLTDAGREAKERLGTVVGGIRSRVAGAVPPDDYATTMASLEAIARELGWDESTPAARGRGWGRRFGGPRAFGPARFGHGAGFGHGMSHDGPWGHRYDDEGCRGHGPRGHHGHDRHDHEGHGRGGHFRHDGHGDGHGRDHRGHDSGNGHGAESAYERGFVAGFGAARAGGDAGAADSAA